MSETVVYQCPRCCTSMEIDQSAKPSTAHTHAQPELRAARELLEDAYKALDSRIEFYSNTGPDPVAPEPATPWDDAAGHLCSAIRQFLDAHLAPSSAGERREGERRTGYRDHFDSEESFMREMGTPTAHWVEGERQSDRRQSERKGER